jgi:hypothetical protein
MSNVEEKNLIITSGYKISAILKITIAVKAISNGAIPIFNELSRVFPWNFDADRTSLSERNEINPITATYPNSGSPGAASIDSALDEIILVILIDPSLCVFLG